MNDYTATLNGLTIGVGTPYRWTGWPSGLGTPEIRSEDRYRPRRPGAVGGDDLLGVRTIAFEISIQGEQDVLEQQLSALNAAFAPSATDVWLDLRMTGNPSEYSLRGRPRGVEWDLTRRFTFGLADARCTFVCLDPLKYGPQVTNTLALPSGTAGLAVPAAVPAVLGAQTGGEVTITNNGTAPIDWTATINGPIDTPRLEMVGLGRRVAFDIALVSGETLVLDSRSASALLNGSTPRTSTLQPGSRWWQFPVGSSTVRYRAASGSGSADISFRNGYL
jgi:hypothetical protein